MILKGNFKGGNIMFSKKLQMLVLASILSGCMLVGCTQTTANNQNTSKILE